ncbi:MAG: protein kinase [Planctomycetota bacterium]
MALSPPHAGNLCPACLLRLGLRTPRSSSPDSGKNRPLRRRRAPHAAAAGDSEPVPPSDEDGASNFSHEDEEIPRDLPHLDLLKVLGHGGMGKVVLARQRELDRLVAVKFVRKEGAQIPEFAQRFAREARALAKLSHPNIVTVYDFGEVNGFFYLVMEFVAGSNLRTVIQSGRVHPSTALAMVSQICEALQFAHDEGVVHRDIKPENILVDRRGRIKVADFGIAKILDASTSDKLSTQSGLVVGTPAYMAPEQLERPKDVDHRADIYSLGVVFYELLTGELPLGVFPPPSRASGLTEKVDEVVLRALEKEPDRRYQRASEVGTAVDGLATTIAQLPSEPITVSCAACGRKLRVKGKALLQSRVRCPNCRASVELPRPTRIEPEAPSPSNAEQPRERPVYHYVALIVLLLLMFLTSLLIALPPWRRAGEREPIADGSTSVKQPRSTPPLGKNVAGSRSKDSAESVNVSVSGPSSHEPDAPTVTGPPPEKPAGISTESPNVEKKADEAISSTILRYRWDSRRSYTYQVKVDSEKEDSLRSDEGHFSFSVANQEGPSTTLHVHGFLFPHRRPRDPRSMRGFLLEGEPLGVRTPPFDASFTMDSLGNPLRSMGTTVLPHGLGQIEEMLFLRLPQGEEASWEHAAEVTVTLTEDSFISRQSPKLLPATDKVQYRRLADDGKMIRIEKVHEVRTRETVGDQPMVRWSGKGEIEFDLTLGVPRAVTMKYELASTSRTVTVRMPIQFKGTLQDQNDKKPSDRKAPNAEPTTLSEQQVNEMVAQLSSPDGGKAREAAEQLSRARREKEKQKQKVSKALETLLKSGDVFTRTAAMKALKGWYVQDSVPAVFDMLDDESFFIRRDAMEILANEPSPQAAKRVADRLGEDRHEASECLIKMGSVAADPVHPLTSDLDDGVRREACKILQQIGTRNSLPYLQRALRDPDPFVRQTAQKAIEAIERRL